MKGQMTIFDFGYPQIICDLIFDLKSVFPGMKVDSYRVWEHVPNLGKRLWAEVDDFQNTDITWISEKYKELEISVNVVPSLRNKGEWMAYISTMWRKRK